MPIDDRLRDGLRRIADEVDPDVERGFQRATSARAPSPVRRAGTVLAYAAAAVLGMAVIGVGASLLVDRFGMSPTPGGSVESASPSANVCSDPQLPTCAGRQHEPSHLKCATPAAALQAPVVAGLQWRSIGQNACRCRLRERRRLRRRPGNKNRARGSIPARTIVCEEKEHR